MENFESPIADTATINTSITTPPSNYAEGTMLDPGNGLFLVLDGAAHHVPNPEVYNRLFANWKSVPKNRGEILTGTPVSLDAYLAKGTGGKVYFVNCGYKRWIISPVVFDQYNFNRNTIKILSQAAIDAIPSGPDILATFTGLTMDEVKNAIGTYGPVLRFNPDERFSMCSIEWFLSNATLHDNKTGRDRSVAIDTLPLGDDGNDHYCLVLKDSAKGGDLSTAKAYVHVLGQANFTDLQFLFFYAYNGPGTAHVNGLLFDTIVHTGNVDLSPLGEHYGDWEMCTIRIDNRSKAPTDIFLSQHGSSQHFVASQLTQFERIGNRFVVYASNNGHAVYAAPGPNYTEHHKETFAGAGLEFFLRNDTANSSHSLDCSKSYTIVSAIGVPTNIPDARWLDYVYRWGPSNVPSHADKDMVIKILQAGLGWLAAIALGLLGPMASYIASRFIKDDFNGPYGPKQKSFWSGDYAHT